VYFNVNLKLLTKLINSAFVGACVCVCVCVCVNYVDFKMHGAKIKISVKVSTAVFTGHLLCPDPRGSTFFLNVSRYLKFTFQMNIGLTK